MAAFYGGIAFVILQVIESSFDYLHIPDWIGSLLVVMLLIGFPVAMVLAWVFDITPEGIVRTEGSSTGSGRQQTKPGTSNKALVAVTIIAVSFGIWGWMRDGGGSDGALASYEHSIAVMPFENLTNDPDFDVWERGLANLVISDLSGSKELYVLDSQSLFDVIQAVQQSRKAQLLPDLAREVANRTEVKQVILGDILKIGTRFRVQARLLTVKTGRVDFSHKVDAENEDDLILAAEEISRGMQNHLELNILRGEATVEGLEGQTKSAAAFKLYTEGLDHFWRMQFQQAIPLLETATSIDSNFAAALTWLTYAYMNTGQVGQTKAAIARSKRLSGRISPIQQLITDLLDAWVNKRVNDQIRLVHQIVKAEPLSRVYWYVLGLTYGYMSQPEQAVRYYDKAYALCLQWESYWEWVPLYRNFGAVLHETGSHRKELAVYKYGLKAVPEAPIILSRLGIHYLSTGDTLRAADVLDRYREALVRSGSSEAQILYRLGLMHESAGLLDQAQAYYEQFIENDPENALAYNSLAWLLIDNELDMKAGLAMAEKALDLRPGDYSNLDTYGWGLFKLGRYAEAADALERSWALRDYYRQSAMDRLEAARKALKEQS